MAANFSLQYAPKSKSFHIKKIHCTPYKTQFPKTTKNSRKLHPSPPSNPLFTPPKTQNPSKPSVNHHLHPQNGVETSSRSYKSKVRSPPPRRVSAPSCLLPQRPPTHQIKTWQLGKPTDRDTAAVTLAGNFIYTKKIRMRAALRPRQRRPLPGALTAANSDQRGRGCDGGRCAVVIWSLCRVVDLRCVRC